MTLSEELTWRGFVNQTTFKDLAVLDGNPITFYWGVDPSADSMTIGNLAAAMMVKCFTKHGHKPVLLVGGATGLIGDPDGKSTERDLKSLEEITANKAAIKAQYEKIFNGLPFETVDNYDWFKDFGYLDFLRTIGKHVPMRQMLAREFIQSRLGEAGSGISYAEFSYVLIQAYDFLWLHQHHGVTLQVCGSDQWGNSIAGVDLIRRVTGDETHVYSTPLIVNKTTGVKFGKSENGAVWLDAKKTTPTEFYQFWVTVDDAGVEDYLKVFTELSKAEVDTVMQAQYDNPRGRAAQTKLAEEVTKLIHGDAAMHLAKNITDYLVGSKPIDEADEAEVTELKKQIKSTMLSDKQGSIIDALAACGLAASKSEARRLLSEGAVYLNGEKVTRDAFQPDDFHGGRLLLRRGKALKDAALIEI